MKSVSISRADLAAVCVAALIYPEAQNKTFEVFSIKEPADEGWQLKFAALDK